MKTTKNTKTLVGRTLNYKLYGTQGYDSICYSLIAEEEGVIKKQTCAGIYYGESEVGYGKEFLGLSEKALNDLMEFGIYRNEFKGQYGGTFKCEVRLN